MGRGKDEDVSKKIAAEALIKTKKFKLQEVGNGTGLSLDLVKKISGSMKKGIKIVRPSDRVGKCGRKKKFTTRAQRQIIRHLMTVRNKPTYAILESLRQSTSPISRVTLNKIAKSRSLRKYRKTKKFILTQKMMKKRYEWAKKMFDKPAEFWSKVFTTSVLHYVKASLLVS
jgi:hypothetical protein